MTEPSFLRATRTAYDSVAVDYAKRGQAELAAKPLDRALLATYAELVQTADLGPVADLGCGPGHVTAHLHTLGLAVFGIDLSAEMVTLARQAYPGLRFDEGSMTDLDLPDAALGGIVAWYSIIHIPPDRLSDVFAEFHRVLAPDGHLMLAFQVGDEMRHLTEAFGHPIALDAYRLSPAWVAELLGRAGFTLRAQLIREPDESEKVQQAILLARKPADVNRS